jgi:hypothetical protein
VSASQVEIVSGVLIAAVLLLVVLLVVRRRYLVRGHGGITLSIRNPGFRWALGVGRYDADELRWYRVVGLRVRPIRVFPRADIHVTGQRQPTAAEQRTLPPGTTITQCRIGDSDWELAIGGTGTTGLLSWLESAAPDSTI